MDKQKLIDWLDIQQKNAELYCKRHGECVDEDTTAGKSLDLFDLEQVGFYEGVLFLVRELRTKLEEIG